MADSRDISPAAPGRALRAMVFSERFPPEVGGSSRWMGKIAEHWPGEVAVLTATRQGLPDREVQGNARIERVRYAVPTWVPDNVTSALGYVGLVATLVKAVRRHRTEVILCGRGLSEGIAARAAQVWTQVPYVCVAHGEEIEGCLSSKSLGVLLRWAYGGAALVVANSHNSAALAISAGAREERCTVVHPGVSVEDFRPREGVRTYREKLGLTGKTVVSVGRLVSRKNNIAVVYAVSALVKAGHDVTYLIAGEGPERSDIEGTARRLGIARHVRLLGEVPEEDLTPLYQSADIFALPGIRDKGGFEGFGIVFLEAAVAGVPSIAGRAGGSGEAVLDGQTGLVVDGTDIDAVTEALRRLIEDDELRRGMGRAAQRRAEEEFDWPIVVRRFAEAVRRGLRGDSRAPGAIVGAAPPAGAGA